MYKLSNSEREYFGLGPIGNDWEEVILKGNTYIANSILFFDGDVLKRHIISTDINYFEKQYNEQTIERKILVPKTSRGKEKKITSSVLEQRQPEGIYLNISLGNLTIGNYNTQTTFYSNTWDQKQYSDKPIPNIVEDFIKESPQNHFEEIEKYRNAQRKNIRFKSGDYFSFKIDRNSYGFGRVLLDVNKIRKKKLIDDFHGLNLLMGSPVMIHLFAYKSETKNVDIESLDKLPKLPSDVMMDNLLFYGEYEIIGHKNLEETDLDFPISHGKDLGQKPIVFLQWGLIHRELPLKIFDKYIHKTDGPIKHNPYGYYGIGFRPSYDTSDVLKTIANNGTFDFNMSDHYISKLDLRNPVNKEIRENILKAFGLDPLKSYYQNSLETNTILPSQLKELLK